MAALDTTRTTYGTASAVNRTIVFLTDLVASFVSWNDSRVTRKALSSLSDRELEDIGLIRGDIDYVANSYLIR
ncbi:MULTISPECIES: DUF1127 domain-containing protein [unclassified Sulfitobacter]|uniref:DUF1127 domain-containing protein n=1 Tax=unclassified Sulfitobacter TaxID=196795 RepID=UPI0007C335CB|nr:MULTISPECIES: DUF1127 domain-containing protein [unclassified Sulfitobacter]KZX94881.1 hypothetical protein A3721_09415 [Sulfitobacter sp. HI0023]KZY22526.1 hypothetical protein A3728_10750 [Sulfitobacter sp. HI0040]KZZ69712.1 hypothetical protein A3764_10075 [Sulfitobacter sp. HI0129]